MSVRIWILLSIVVPARARAELSSPLDLGQLIALARDGNPELRERRELARSTRPRARAVGRLDDPMLMLEWWQQPLDFSSVPFMLTFRQPLPWPGVRGARRDVAERGADA